MRRIAALGAVVLLAAMASQAYAGDEWRGADTAREAVFLTLYMLDWGQTRTIARHPERRSEANAFLGEHPSAGRVDRYFAVTALAHVGVAYVLPSSWRAGFQYITIGIELSTVNRNRHLGIAVDF